MPLVRPVTTSVVAVELNTCALKAPLPQPAAVYGVTVYPVMALPVLVGAVQLTVAR